MATNYELKKTREKKRRTGKGEGRDAEIFLLSASCGEEREQGP